MVGCIINEKAVSKRHYPLAKITAEASVILNGLKPSVLVNLKNKTDEISLESIKTYIRKWLKLSVEVLLQNENRSLIFIYDKEALFKIINTKKAREFLKGFNYNDLSEKALLCALKKRCMVEEFPHEIGVFLGYPIDDVISFIENCGKNCLYCGYWKVYHDVNGAKKIFEKYNFVKKQVISLINEGTPFYQAINIKGDVLNV